MHCVGGRQDQIEDQLYACHDGGNDAGFNRLSDELARDGLGRLE